MSANRNAFDVDINVLAHVPLLEGLQPEEFRQLSQYWETRVYELGDTLFIRGDPGGELIIVLDGEIELFIYDEGNAHVVLNVVKSGGFFGEVTLFDRGARSTNARAIKTTQTIVLRQEVMIAFLRKHPDSAIHIINVLAKRLRDSTEQITSRGSNAFQMLQETRSVWDHIADRVSGVVGSWGYLAGLVSLIFLWAIVSVLRAPNAIPAPLDALGILITTIGALQLPLILMSQNRQDRFEQIQANLDHQVNVKAQLSILEVTRKLEWLQEAMMKQANRLDEIEADRSLPRQRPSTPVWGTRPNAADNDDSGPGKQ